MEKRSTKRMCKIKVAAVLVVEKRSETVGVLATGTKYSTKICLLLMALSGLCDGHEIVCYHLTSVYLMTEIYKLKD